MGSVQSPKKSVGGSTKSSKARAATTAAKGKKAPRESPMDPGATVKDGVGKLGKGARLGRLNYSVGRSATPHTTSHSLRTAHFLFAGARKVANNGEKVVEGVGNVTRKLVGYREKDTGTRARAGGVSDAREANASAATPAPASDRAAATPTASAATGAGQRSCGAVYPTEAVPLAQQATILCSCIHGALAVRALLAGSWPMLTIPRRLPANPSPPPPLTHPGGGLAR